VKEERKFLVATRSGILNALIENFLASSSFGIVVGTAVNGKEAVTAAEASRPDWVFLESSLRERDCVEVTAELKRMLPKAKIVIVCLCLSVTGAVRLFKAGAMSFLRPDLDGRDLKRSMEMIFAGKRVLPKEVLEVLEEKDWEMNRRKYLRLTKRERTILFYVAEGMTNAEIGYECGISQRTVEGHRQNIMRKTGARSTAELVRFAVDEGMA